MPLVLRGECGEEEEGAPDQSWGRTWALVTVLQPPNVVRRCCPSFSRRLAVCLLSTAFPNSLDAEGRPTQAIPFIPALDLSFEKPGLAVKWDFWII